MSTATLSIRTDVNLKKEVQEILKGYGLTISSAFNQYMSAIRAGRIEPAVFNYTVSKDKMQAWEDEIEKMKKNKNSRSFKNADELLKYLKS